MPIFSSTITDLVANKLSQPYYQFNVANNKISIGDVSAMPVGPVGTGGTGDYSIEGLVRFNRITGNTMVILGDSNADANDFMRLCLFTEGSAGRIRFDGHTASPNQYNWIISTPANVVAIDKWHHIVGVVDRDTSGNCGIWVDGIKVSDSVGNLDSGENSHDFNNFNIGIDYANNYDFDGQIAKVRAFNFALSDTEVKEFYSGASVPWKNKGASQTNNITHTGWVGASTTQAGTGWTPDADADFSSVTSGGHNNMPILTIIRKADTSVYTYTYPNQLNDGQNIATTLIEGKRYRASVWVKSGTVDVAAALNVFNSGWGGHTDPQPASVTSTSSWQEISKEFTASGGGTDGIFFLRSYLTVTDSTQLWSDPKIVPIGAVAEYDGSGISSDKWFDKSGNDLHGTVTGATIENAPSGGTPSAIYEEGSWTPTLEDPDGDEPSYFTNSGSYTRVGRLVTFQGNFYINSTSGMSGTIEIHGLPYTSVNQTAVTFGELRQTDRGGSGNLTFLASIVANTAKISMVINNGDGKANSNALQHSAIGYATQWFFGASYEI